MERFLASEDEFSRFYRANVNDLLVFFTRRTFDPQAALDLSAETFAQAFAARRGFRGDSDIEAGAWLYAIARRQLSQYFEHGAVRRTLTRRLVGGVPTATDLDCERIEQLASLDNVRDVLREEIARLDVGQREALWLRVVEEQSYSRVASRLGVSEQTARKRVSRALRALSEPLAALETDTGASNER